MVNYLALMRLAKFASETSKCLRRKIGAVMVSGTVYTLGSNNASYTCSVCTRESGICPAIHAEVDAVLGNRSYPLSPNMYSTMAVWSEVPCEQCLTFLHRYGGVRLIYCLSPESYQTIYPQLRIGSIAYRMEYAERLGISICEVDLNQFLEDPSNGISRRTSTS